MAIGKAVFWVRVRASIGITFWVLVRVGVMLGVRMKSLGTCQDVKYDEVKSKFIVDLHCSSCSEE